MLHKKVEGNKGVLAKLNLNCNSISDEIGLVVGGDGRLAGCFDLRSLLDGREMKRLPDELLIAVTQYEVLDSFHPR
jgi:hypothetical protein